MRVLLVAIAVTGIVVVASATLLTRPQVAAADGPATCTVETRDTGVRLSPEQMETARAVVSAAREMAVSRRGVVLALQAGMQESGLRADTAKGRAVGTFQQIVPGPYGAYLGYDRTDAAAAARGFFTVLSRDDPSYETDGRSNAAIIQLVQRSGAGASYYVKWQSFAENLTSALYGTGAMRCTDQSAKGPQEAKAAGTAVSLPPAAGVRATVTPPSPAAAKAIAAALSWLGTPYVWGGGTANGPSGGGFDCSGLTRYAYAQAGVTLPRTSRSQRAWGGQVVPWSAAVAGDLLFWGSSPGTIHHVTLYLGVIDGRPYMVEAPNSGLTVRVTPVRTGGDFRAEVVRPSSQEAKS